jgi:hypothetical protein
MRTILLSILALAALIPPQRTIDDFFNDFTAPWIRANPNQAVSTRYFTGEEQGSARTATHSRNAGIP